MMEFMGSMPIFYPFHVQDIMKKTNMFSPKGLSLENPTNVNEYKNEGTQLSGPFVNPQHLIRTRIS